MTNVGEHGTPHERDRPVGEAVAAGPQSAVIVIAERDLKEIVAKEILAFFENPYVSGIVLPEYQAYLIGSLVCDRAKDIQDQ